MKKAILILFIFLCTSFADEPIRLIKIQIPNHDEVYKLNKYRLTIIDAGKEYAKALVNDREIETLKAAGYQLKILIEDYKSYKDEIFRRGFYHTYTQVYSVLDSFVTNYPDVCRLDTIGYSVLGRAIWAMRVTDNPDIEENESEIRLAGNMHGDEHIGTEITLYFLRYLLTNYATNPQVQNLIDNREIWILPTLNPDGKVANTRRNANNVDLNRDYGYFWDGWGGSPGPSSQIENQVLIQHLEENDVVLEYNYHSAAQYVNYPWDYHPADPPDSQYIIYLSQIYADSANLTAINGYDWYQVNGSLQDYTIGVSGALAWTIETLEPTSSSSIDQICFNNRDALMDLCNRAGWGIEGVVKDSVTDSLLYARIEFINPERIDVYSDPTLGDFHKIIEQGLYDVRVSANGYMPKTISNILVPATGSVSLGNVLLIPDSSYLYAFRVILCRYANHAEDTNKTNPRFTLGSEDSLFFSLGQNGYIVLDMGSNSPIRNSSGYDFTVFEGDDGTLEGYQVFASNDWNGPWHLCGSATGTANFDLTNAGLSQARYVKVVDDGSSSSGPYAGFDLDAIKGVPPANAPNIYMSDNQILDANGILEPGETSDFIITLHNSGILAAINTTGILNTNDMYITINDSLSFYGDMLPDSEQTNINDPFNIAASPSTPYGHLVDFELVVSADNYLDTIAFSLVVGQLVPSDTGYYYVYYSGGLHTYAPTYEWFEIAPPGPGSIISQITDEDADTVTLSLPFTLRYYGQDYTSIGVCSNGFLELGSSTYRFGSNTGIPSVGGPRAMLAPFWDDLDPRPSPTGYGDIYQYYDAANHRWIVEYKECGHYGRPNIRETFQVILLDPMYYPTPTGDGEILYFYHTITDVDSNTVGIENYTETVGIEYCFNGAYHELAVPVTDSFALRYTTYPPDYTGVEESSELTVVPMRTMMGVLYPNPFKGQLNISYQVATRAEVGVQVYDVMGRLVRNVARGVYDPGYYTVNWDGRDDVGRRVPAGVYFVKFKTDNYQKVKKAILLR